MPDEPTPDGPPVLRASDADREAVVARLQKAVGDGRLDLDEFGQRASAAYAAKTTAELDLLMADLPADAPPGTEIVGTRVQESISLVFGDVVVAGGATVPRKAGTVFGDIRIDLRGLRTDADRVELELSTVFGNIQVIVSEGVDAELQGRTVFGNRTVDLAPVARLEGTPLVVVRGRSVFGDLRLRSLTPGESASRWRALMDRLAERHLPPPIAPPPPLPPRRP
ncbi:MAG TPA: DUF1707 domain-containing protein [Blastococcus sp.]|nr:DUF1707 domain-containing protein [Blastococcus sp.]